MFRHPNVIASIVLGIGMLVSSILICVRIDSLDATLKKKPMSGSGSSFPTHLNLTLRNSADSPVEVRVKTDAQKPLLMKQIP